MAARATLSPEQRRLLRITGRMPLASVSDLAPFLGVSEEQGEADDGSAEGRRMCGVAAG